VSDRVKKIESGKWKEERSVGWVRPVRPLSNLLTAFNVVRLYL
jgi:hypothetical protein